MTVRRKIANLNKSLSARGFAGTLTHYARVLIGMARRYTAAGRRAHQRQLEMDKAFAQKLRQVDAEFDTSHQLDTGGRIELDDLSIDSESKPEGVFYQAVFPDRFREWIDSLKIEPKDYIFVDIGAGKGRALFLAQDMGFRRAIGVEFARELVDICKENIRRRAADRVPRRPVEILHMDGLAYDLPEEPVVLFLNNPFGEVLMARMAERIQLSLRRAPRNIKIVYGNPLYDHVLISKIPELRRLTKTEMFNSYESINSRMQSPG
jgi:hypothetical protein